MRYFNPTPQQYKSQFVPPDLELMYKVGQERALEDAKADALMGTLESEYLINDKGIYSKDEDVKRVNESIKSTVNNIRDKFYSGEMDAKQAALSIANYSNALKQDKAYNILKADSQLSKETLKKAAEGKFTDLHIGGKTRSGKRLGDYIGGKLNVNDYIDPLNDEMIDIASAHGMYGPGNFEEDHKTFIQQASDDRIIGDVLKDSGYHIDYIIDPETKQKTRVWVETQTGKVVKGIDKEAIRLFAKKYADENWERSGAESVNYMRQSDATKEDYINRLTSLIKTGITDVQIQDQTQAKPLQSEGGEGANVANPQTNVNTVPSPGTEVDYGIKLSFNEILDLDGPDFMYDLQDNWKRQYSDKPFDFKKLSDPQSNEYKFVKSNATFGTGFKKLSDLDSRTKEVMRYFMDNNPGWRSTIPYLENGYDLPFGTKAKLFGQFAEVYENMKSDLVRTNNTAVILEPTKPNPANPKTKVDNETYTLYTGVKGVNAKVSDLLNQSVVRGSKIWDYTNNKFLEQSEIEDLINHPEISKQNISGLAETTRENVLPFMTGDANFIKAANVAIGGKLYGIQNTSTTNEDILINTLYNRGKLSLGLPVTISLQSGDKEFKLTYQINKDNTVKLNNIETPFQSVSDMLGYIYNPDGTLNTKRLTEKK